MECDITLPFPGSLQEGWEDDSLNFPDVTEDEVEAYMQPSRKAMKQGKGKVCIRAKVAHQAGAYPGFRGMKRLGIFLLPPGWDASPSQGYPQHYIRRYPFIHLGEERHCESKVSCLRTQRNVPGQAREELIELWTRTQC